MADQHLTEEQRDAVRKIEKLMRLAGRTTSEAEAASATAKASEMLLAYNLSVANLGSADEGSGARAQESYVGGFYEYERDLWREIAELNFCMHWLQPVWVDRTEKEQRHRRVLEMTDQWRRERKKVHQHRLVGRTHNVAATRAMAEYILQSVERLCRDFLAAGLPHQDDGVVGMGAALRSRRAVSFREGVAERVVEKIVARRREQVSEEQRKRREEAARAVAAGMSSAGSSATAVTISSLRKSERDANLDAIYGEGFTAKMAQDRADRARLAAEAEAAHVAWAAANPEEAREEALREEKERRAADKRAARRTGRPYREPKEKDRDWAAFRAGHQAGASVGIDQQVQKSSQRSIGR